MKSGDTFTIEVKGRCSLEDQSEAQDRRVQFYQCRSSFQPYAVLLDPDVSAENLALVDVVVFKHMDTGTRTEVCQLRVQLTIPPPPAKPKTVLTKGNNDSRYKQPNPGKSPFQSLKSFFSRWNAAVLISTLLTTAVTFCDAKGTTNVWKITWP